MLKNIDAELRENSSGVSRLILAVTIPTLVLFTVSSIAMEKINKDKSLMSDVLETVVCLGFSSFVSYKIFTWGSSGSQEVEFLEENQHEIR